VFSLTPLRVLHLPTSSRRRPAEMFFETWQRYLPLKIGIADPPDYLADEDRPLEEYECCKANRCGNASPRRPPSGKERDIAWLPGQLFYTTQSRTTHPAV
jgi:hypothetical protein